MESVKTSFVCGPVAIHIEGPAEEIKRCLADDVVAEHLVKTISTAGQASPRIADSDALELSLEHAWDWFSLHADHRMRSIYFFLVSVAFLSAAYVTALRFSHPTAAAGISVVGLLLTFCFSRLELRIRELVKAGEHALRPLEEKLAEVTRLPQMKIVDSVEASKHCFVKYSVVINTLHTIIGLLFVAGLALAIATHKGMV